MLKKNSIGKEDKQPAEVEVVDPEQSKLKAQPVETTTPAPTNETQPTETQPTETPTQPETSPTETPSDKPTEQTPTPPKIPVAETQPKPNDKFIIKISLPVERDFDCKPGTVVVAEIKL